MKIIIEADGSTTKCEVDNKNIKDCDVFTKNIVFNAFKVITNKVLKEL